MMHLDSQKWICFMCVLLLAGCSQIWELPEARAGRLRFEPYVAIGDGYTAGFSNSQPEARSSMGLYESGQENAFPVLLAQQLELAGPLRFEGRPATGPGSGYLELSHFDPPLCSFLKPRPALRLVGPTSNWSSPPDSPAAIQHLGIPHLSAARLSGPDSAWQADPFFRRVNWAGAASPLSLFAQSAPQFATLWLGLSDLLDYALSGASKPEYLPLSPDAFASAYERLLDSLQARSGAELRVLVGNLPDPTRFPFFEAVEPVFVNIENCSGARMSIYIETHQGASVRIASSEDRILLTSKPFLGTINGRPGLFGLHPDNPLPDKWVLDRDESQDLRVLLDAYNGIIAGQVQRANEVFGSPRVLLVDLRAAFDTLPGGLIEDGVALSTEHLYGGIFSADGIYLTPRGNAWLANRWIAAINAYGPWGASIPPLNLSDYPGNIYP